MGGQKLRTGYFVYTHNDPAVVTGMPAARSLRIRKAPRGEEFGTLGAIQKKKEEKEENVHLLYYIANGMPT